MDNVSCCAIYNGFTTPKDLFEVIKGVYAFIIIFEQNSPLLDTILKSAKEINYMHADKKRLKKIEDSIVSFKNSFSNLVFFFKEQLYPFILKYFNKDIINSSCNNFIQNNKIIFRKF